MTITLSPTENLKNLQQTVIVSIPSDNLTIDEVLELFKGACVAFGFPSSAVQDAFVQND